MSLARKVAHNTIIQIIGKGISLVLGVLALGMMTRYLGQEGFGRFTTITVFLQFFGILVDMGLTLMTMQFLSEPDEDRENILHNLLGLRLVSALLFLSLAPLVALFFPYDRELIIGITFTTISYFCIALNQIFIGFFQNKLRSDIIASAEVAGRIVLVVFIGIGVFLGRGLFFILAATVMGSIANLLVNMLAARRFTRIVFAFEWSVWKRIIKRSWPIALSIVFNLIYFKADTIILSIIQGAHEVGIYGAPYRMLEVLISFPFIFIGIIFPILNNAFVQNDRTTFTRGVQDAFDALAIIALPLVGGGMMLAEPIMRLVAGDAFVISAAPLRILMLAVGIIFLGSFFAHLIIIAQKQKAMIPWYAAVAGISLLGYLIFIPRYSYIGAAWMTVVAEGLIAIIGTFIAIRALHITLTPTVFLKSALATLIMLLALFLLKELPIAIPLVAGVAIYGGTLFILGGIRKNLITILFTTS